MTLINNNLIVFAMHFGKEIRTAVVDVTGVRVRLQFVVTIDSKSTSGERRSENEKEFKCVS